MKITNLPGLTVGDDVAIVIPTTQGKNTTIAGVLSGITVLESGNVGLTVFGLDQWIWLEEKYSVTWAKAE
jgi:ABC-type protease/lipase transport system fused ATPase/permease subunit